MTQLLVWIGLRLQELTALQPVIHGIFKNSVLLLIGCITKNLSKQSVWSLNRKYLRKKKFLLWWRTAKIFRENHRPLDHLFLLHSTISWKEATRNISIAGKQDHLMEDYTQPIRLNKTSEKYCVKISLTLQKHCLNYVPWQTIYWKNFTKRQIMIILFSIKNLMETWHRY